MPRRERGGLGGVDGAAARCGRPQTAQHVEKAVDVHGFGQAIVDRLRDDRMIHRNFDVARRERLGAGERRGKRSRRADRRRASGASGAGVRLPPRTRSSSSARARSSATASRTSAPPAPPARARRGRCRDADSRTRRRAGSCAAVPSERTIASSLAAAWSSKPKPQQKRLRSASPHARLIRDAERRVHDELHAAALVEEALENHALSASGRRRAPARPASTYSAIWTAPPRLAVADASRRDLAALASRASLFPQGADLRRKLARAAGRFAEPERNRRGRALGVGDAHDAAARRAECATRRCRAGRCRRRSTRSAKSSLTVPTSVPSGSRITW